MSPRALRQQIGQLLIGSFPSTTVPVELRGLAREFDLGGVILFARNVEAPEQVAELAHDLQQLARAVPLWVSVDQEGGRVARLRDPFTEWPPMIALGRSGDEALAARFAAALARELRTVGISLDFAPVLDVYTNRKNTVIGDRALGEQAQVAARFGAAIVRGLQEQGVAACGKHFPGHGDTVADSHHELPVVEHPPERLREVEFEPFRAAIAAEVASIMTAHLLVPSLDEERPATLSPRIIDAILRNELGFDGIIVSDDLEMRAIADRWPAGAAAVGAIEAGCDAFLICSGDIDKQVSALEAVIRAVEAETLHSRRIDDALARSRRVKERFAEMVVPGLAAPSPLSKEWRPPPPPTIRASLGSGEHQRVAEEMAKFL